MNAFLDKNPIREYKNIKAKLKSKLPGEKQIIVFIENIDRTSKDSVLSLFKALGTILDLPNVVYVISYSKNRLGEIFKDNTIINTTYLDKVINQEINIPVIDTNVKEKLYLTCVKNILTAYGVRKSELKNYEYIADFLVDYVDDLRKFKRLINSAIYEAFGNQLPVTYSPERLVREIIRFSDSGLYKIMQDNPKFFQQQEKPEDENEALAQAFLNNSITGSKNTITLYKDINNNYPIFMSLIVTAYPMLNKIKNKIKSKISY